MFDTVKAMDRPSLNAGHATNMAKPALTEEPDPMTRDLDTPILTLDGQPIAEGDRPLTVGDCAVNALLMSSEGDGAAKLACFRMAERLRSGGEVDLSAEDLAAIKAAVGGQVPAVIVGPVFEWADA